MWLVNSPKLRIEKYDKGYSVEIQKTTWYGRNYWVHIIAVLGINDQPWYYKTFDAALEQASLYFRWDLLEGTYKFSKNALKEKPGSFLAFKKKQANG